MRNTECGMAGRCHGRRLVHHSSFIVHHLAMKPINVGLLGIGTVGGGTYTVLRRNQEEIGRRAGCAITMKMVADKDLDKVRNIVGERAIVTADAYEVVNNSDIDIVVELIGGTRIARDLVLKAIANGKHVV